MSGAADLARRLAREAEAVCRHYLPQGRRCGHYWVTGDVVGASGRSLYVRLTGRDYGPGAAGKWTDAATGEHGDLLDLIIANRQLSGLGEAIEEARQFLSLPAAPASPRFMTRHCATQEIARRLFQAGQSIVATLAETYLHRRGITAALDWPALRFHPAVHYRANSSAPFKAWPALLAAVTDLDGNITGVQRCWLDPVTATKAPLVEPRRALGHLLGHGVRFGIASDTLAVGEGIETMLALNSILPGLPMVAALSANHLAALGFPSFLRRLYIARDQDLAGAHAAARLRHRAEAECIDVHDLIPQLGDFNDDLRELGRACMLEHLASQIVPEDYKRFTMPA